MKKFLLTLSACALCASVAGAAPAKTAAAKTKVAPVKIAAKAPTKTVAKVAAKPLIVPATKIVPAKIAQVTPGMMKPEEMPGFFPDVPRDHWAFAAVQRLATTGIINGYPGTAPATSPALAAKTADVKVADKVEVAPERVAAAPGEEKSAAKE